MEKLGFLRKPGGRKALAIIAPAVLMGIVSASAASLGGITAPSLGADTAVISACDTDGVTLAYTTSYDAALGRYQVTDVDVTGIDATCNGKTASITLKDAGNVSLAFGSITVASGAAAISLSGSGASANAVAGAALLIG